MTYTKDNLRTLFRSKFDLSKWQNFLADYFKANEILRILNSSKSRLPNTRAIILARPTVATTTASDSSITE